MNSFTKIGINSLYIITSFLQIATIYKLVECNKFLRQQIKKIPLNLSGKIFTLDKLKNFVLYNNSLILLGLSIDIEDSCYFEEILTLISHTASTLHFLHFIGLNTFTSCDVSSLFNFIKLRHLILDLGLVYINFSFLSKLIHLDISGSSITNLTDIKSCISLEIITLNKCTKLTDISGLTNLLSLTTISIKECHKLKIVPSFDGCLSLQKITIISCVKLEIISALLAIISLKYFSIRNCPNINNLNKIEGSDSLKEVLFVGDCSSTGMDFVSKCPNLKRLTLRSWIGCSDATPIKLCTKLESISISNSQPELLPILSCLPNLCTIAFSYRSITNLDELKDCSAITHLTLDSNSLLSNITMLETLTTLTFLDINNCGKISDIPLQNCTSLRTLNLTKCSNLINIDFLRYCTLLEKLFISGISGFTNLDPLHCLSHLTSITIFNCDSLNDISILSNCIFLEEISIIDCKELVDISPLSSLPKLKKLSYSDKLVNVSCLKDFIILSKFLHCNKNT